ncbi:hypothetical protein [Bailinhaonella thermotolerans]|uniref:Uncharacterized protein n=1 Tax=Bailinhaonella thermotolerans TaxID=1070861 RepID=A0A3A4AXF8_9ACTN|nr:hypothetical protein [Bailinhaonella thermotolerans]RJL32084.1 hypothetical protein D5H75_16805 [Bailinhaonella thermotolerans]
MRSSKVVSVLALVAALVGTVASAPAAGAAARSTTCRVTLYDLDAVNVGESDGRDEFQLLVDSYFYPNGWVGMRARDDADPVHFDNVSTTIGTTGIESFALREVTPPILGSGTSYGAISAYGGTCATLSRGQDHIYREILSGYDETYYEYEIAIKMTGL